MVFESCGLVRLLSFLHGFSFSESYLTLLSWSLRCEIAMVESRLLCRGLMQVFVGFTSTL